MIDRHLASSSKYLALCPIPHRAVCFATCHRQVLSWQTASNSRARSSSASHVPQKRSFSQCTLRSAKTKVSVRLDDLPQGLVPLDPLPIEDMTSLVPLPTVVRQAQENMRKFENCVLLTRVGGFYELYFEHATEFGPLLNLKTAPKAMSRGRDPVPMVRISTLVVETS